MSKKIKKIKRVKLKFLLNELDKMCKKYYIPSLKEAFLDSPRYKYKVISKNKQSRSLLRRIKSFVLTYEHLEPVLSPSARVYPGPKSNEFTVKFSDLASKVESASKVNFNYSNIPSCGYIGFGVAQPTRFGEFSTDLHKIKEDLDLKEFINKLSK